MSKQIAIIGAGLTGLTAATKLAAEGLGGQVTVIEAHERPGGQIQTYHFDDFIVESGPSTAMNSGPEINQLFSVLNDRVTPVIANDAARKRWIWFGDHFECLPSSLIGGATTPLFRFSDKLRLVGEPFRRRGTNPNETVGELAERRLGKSFVDYAVDPFIGGIYAGNPYNLVTRHALPKLWRLENEHGSFIRGTIAKMIADRKAKKNQSAANQTSASQALANGPLPPKATFSCEGGLGALIDAMWHYCEEHGVRFIFNAHDVQVSPSNATATDETAWQIALTHDGSDEKLIVTDVITTVPGHTLPSLFKDDIAQRLNPVLKLRYAPIVLVSIGFKNLPGVDRGSFGGLVPSVERRDVLGVLIPSTCFPGRATGPDPALYAVFIGGTRSPELTKLSDNELANIALSETREMMRIPADIEPDLIKVFRHDKAIAQYDEVMDEVLAAIDAVESENPGLHLAGNARDGIGIPQRIGQGWRLGAKVAGK